MPSAAARGTEGRRTLLVTFFYVALTVAFAYPVSVHPASRVLVDNPDTHLYLWTLAWDVHALTAQPLSIFDANIYYPYDNTLAYSENLLGSGVIAAPILWLTGNLVLTLNLVQLLSCVLSGLGAYLLGRRAGLSTGAAVIAGIVFLAAPPRFMRLGQLHMTTVQWVPFGLFFLTRYLDEGRRRDAWLTLGTFTLQALTSGHGTIFLGVSMLALVAYRLALGEPLALARRIRDIGVTGLALLLPLVLIYLPYREAQRDMGLVRSLENWLPTPASYLASPSHLHQWVRALFTGTNYNELASAWLFPGVTIVLLALAAIVPGRGTFAGDWRDRARTSAGGFYALLAVLSVAIFLPPPFGLWPHLYYLPGMNFIRVPSRFMILAMLALGVAGGAGFDRLTARLRPAARAAAAVIVGALLIAEYAAMPLDSVPYRIDIPAIDRWLDTRPKPFVVAEVPQPSPGNIGAYERHQTMAMLHAMAHWQKTIHGYSGIRPALHTQLYLELNAFPDDTSIDHLRELGVTYVVVHEDLFPEDRRAELEERYVRLAPRLKLEHQEGAGKVYTLLPKPASP